MPTGKPSSVKYISLVTPRVVLYILSLASREASIQLMHSAGTGGSEGEIGKEKGVKNMCYNMGEYVVHNLLQHLHLKKQISKVYTSKHNN